MKIILFIIIILLFHYLSCDIYYVPDPAHSIFTIQTGINRTSDGDTVLVAPGIYYENIDFRGKKITVASEFIITGDETIIDSTIIDGSAEDCVVRMDSGEDTLSILCGFMIQNGYKSAGAGIYIYQSGAKVEYLRIIDNVAESNNAPRGGGIFVDGDEWLPGYRQIIIRNVEISDNTVFGDHISGGGIYIGERIWPLILENVSVFNNHCEGGVYASSGGGKIFDCYEVIIRNCNFNDNSISAPSSASMGGLSITSVIDATIENCNFTGNSNESYWSVGGGLGIYVSGNAIIRNCLIADNYVVGQVSGIAGMGIYQGDFLIEDCEIRGNNAGYDNNSGTGGMAIASNCNVILNRVLFHDNIADRGSAITASTSDVLLINSVICNNQSIVNGGIHKTDLGRLNIVNSIIWNNDGDELWIDTPIEVGLYHNIIHQGEEEITCTNGGSYFWGEGNIDLYPQFVSIGTDDFHLQEDSPGVDTGVNACQKWGSLSYQIPAEEIIGKNRDMGIYELGIENYHFDLPDFMVSEEDITFSLELEDYMEGMTGILTASCENNLQSVIVDNIISWQPDENWSGFDEVWIDFETDSGENYSDYVLIQVTRTNDAPIIELPESISFNNISNFFFNVMQYIHDIEGQLIRLSADGSEHISVGVHYPDIILNANPGWQGIETITVYAEDDFYRLVSSDTMQVEVYCEPVADCGADIFSREGKEIILDGSQSLDPLLNGLSYQWSTDSELEIEYADSVFAVVNLPETEEMEEALIYLEVNDGYNSSTDSLFLMFCDDEPLNVECSILPEINTVRISWNEPIAAGCEQIDLLGYQLYFEGCEYDTLQNVSDCVYSFDLPEGEYDFGVQAVYSDGQSDIVEVSTTDAEETELVLTPGSHKVYPNPFNPEVTISFSSTEDTENTEINIYNIKGQQVKSFKIQNSVFQIEKVVWDGRDDRGNQVSSGVYFIKLQIGKEIITNKVIMLK